MSKLEMSALNQLVNGDEPYCPRCGSHNGFLGTQGAYFVCGSCKKNVTYGCRQDLAYCTHTWAEEAAASPFKRR